MRKLLLALTLAASCLPLQSVGAAEKPSSNALTQGVVQMTLKVGETTQAEVLEIFGGPNISTVDGNGDEMWVYDRHATVSSNESGGFSIGLGLIGGGSGVGAGGGLGFGKSKSKAETSTRSMTLIIKFGKNKVVSDFKSRSSSF